MNTLSLEYFGYSLPAATGTYRSTPDPTQNTVRTQGKNRDWTAQRQPGKEIIKYQRRPRYGYHKFTLTDHREGGVKWSQLD